MGRLKGFWWVYAFGRWEIAKWDGAQWWFIGQQAPREDRVVVTVGDRATSQDDRGEYAKA